LNKDIVALFPAVKHQNEGIALGYVGLRTLEADIIAVGVIPLLAAVILRQQLMGIASTDTATFVTLGNALFRPPSQGGPHYFKNSISVNLIHELREERDGEFSGLT
jgi:hypothetical protein